MIRRLIMILVAATVLLLAAGCESPCIDTATAATTGVCQQFGKVIWWP